MKTAKAILSVSLKINGIKPSVIAFGIPVKIDKCKTPHAKMMRAPIKTEASILKKLSLKKFFAA